MTKINVTEKLKFVSGKGRKHCGKRSRKWKDMQMTKIKVTEKLKFVLERVENIVGKGENAGYQHFLLFL